jgi:hypothetical protein
MKKPGTLDHATGGRLLLALIAASGDDGIQVTHQPGVDPGPHLLHRHPRGLQEGARLPGKFILMLRLYWPVEPPKPSIIDGTWKPPAVKMVQ